MLDWIILARDGVIETHSSQSSLFVKIVAGLIIIIDTSTRVHKWRELSRNSKQILNELLFYG